MVLLLSLDAPTDEPTLVSTADLPLDTTMMVAEIDRAVVRFRAAISRDTSEAAVDDDDDAITWHDAEWL